MPACDDPLLATFNRILIPVERCTQSALHSHAQGVGFAHNPPSIYAHQFVKAETTYRIESSFTLSG